MINLDFILAGNATFTISNSAGVRYTYKVKRSKMTHGYDRESTFVSLLTGADNEIDYTYLGMLVEGNRVITTRASRMSADSLPVKVINWAINQLERFGQLPEGYSIHHEGRCGRCGRTLTVPESIDSGIGPECQRIMASGN